MVDAWNETAYLFDLLDDVKQSIKSMEANDGFTNAFSRLDNLVATAAAIEFKKPENKLKNRYENIPCYDHSRVTLRNHLGTYIHASWADGADRRKAYIATQGPVPDSFGDFWYILYYFYTNTAGQIFNQHINTILLRYMLWQEKVEVIVKVTREIENRVLKCHRYWPDQQSEPPVKQMIFETLEVRSALL